MKTIKRLRVISGSIVLLCVALLDLSMIYLLSDNAYKCNVWAVTIAFTIINAAGVIVAKSLRDDVKSSSHLVNIN